MREIKFRAWHKKERKMFFEIETMYDNLGRERNQECWDADCFGCFLNSATFNVMQYTGLKDKNGVEIYEGDIVSFHYFYGAIGGGGGFSEEEHELTGAIQWGAFGWAVAKIKGEHWRGYTGYADGEGESSIMELFAMNESSLHEESFEVIGNIYENPELLESV